MDAFTAARLANAIELVKAAGYTVSKPRKKRISKAIKNQRGPTCIARFADGQITRMTTHCPGDVLDYGRGERIAREAWASRHKTTADNSPPISSISFERDGDVLGERVATRTGDRLVAWVSQALAA